MVTLFTSLHCALYHPKQKLTFLFASYCLCWTANAALSLAIVVKKIIFPGYFAEWNLKNWGFFQKKNVCSAHKVERKMQERYQEDIWIQRQKTSMVFRCIFCFSSGVCPEPGGLPFSNRTKYFRPYNVDDQVTYSCYDGGDGNITCQRNGTWTEKPTCTGNTKLSPCNQ